MAFLRQPASPGGYHGEQLDVAAAFASWSPDGTKLAYVLGYPRETLLVVADADARNPPIVATAPLTRWGEDLSPPAWRP